MGAKRRPIDDRTRELAVTGQLAIYTTELAALFLHTTPSGIRCRILRGTLKPDSFGGRGRGKEHTFTRETLLAHAKSVA
jgi:hypothetical protein